MEHLVCRFNYFKGSSLSSRSQEKKDKFKEVDQALGRSRGGFGTKIHLVCDKNGIPLNAIVSPAQKHDAAFFMPVLNGVDIPQRRGRPKNRPQMIMADRAYDASYIRRYLTARAIKSNIPLKKPRRGTKRRKRGPKPTFDPKKYKERNVIERLIGWLKNCRRIATRFEKNAHNFLAMIKLAFIKFYLKKYFSDRT